MSIDPFREMAAALHSRQGFDGTMVKFSKESGWLAGKNGESLNNIQMLALVGDMMRGVVLWLDKKPADYRVGFVRDRYQPPQRDQLGHADRRRWRRPDEDPWAATVFLPLFDVDNDQLFIYSTTSQGGRDCLANLLDAYVHNREVHPEDVNKLPLVTLTRDSYPHPKYGQIAVPLLDIERWIEPPANLKSIIPPASSSPLLLDHVGGSKLIEHDGLGSENPGDEMDAEIPF